MVTRTNLQLFAAEVRTSDRLWIIYPDGSLVAMTLEEYAAADLPPDSEVRATAEGAIECAARRWAR